MKITFGNHEFLLHPSGVLFWPDRAMLIVSDLHLEKGSHFARRGFFLPPYDSHETLARLHKAITDLSPRQILLLGDCFHDATGYERMLLEERELFNRFLDFDPVWIIGNHDRGFIPEGFTAHEKLSIDGITFNHEAESGGEFEISGHFHPKVEIVYKGAFISRPCFIEDGKKLILPAFGAYTGGLSIKDLSIANLMQPNARVYALGRNKIYDLYKSSI